MKRVWEPSMLGFSVLAPGRPLVMLEWRWHDHSTPERERMLPPERGHAV